MWTACIASNGLLYPPQQRLYNDPISEKFLSGGSKYFVKLRHVSPVQISVTAFCEILYSGMLGYLLCRFRYYDEVIEECLATDEIDAIVNLGSGMDPKAYFLPGIEKIRYFEVDHPGGIKRKKETIKRVLGRLPDHVSYIAVGFHIRDIRTELQKAGCDLSSTTLFVWESVSAYLTGKANDAILSFVPKAGSASKIIFSYVSEDLITGENLDNRGLSRLSRSMEKHGLLVLGFDPDTIEDYLAKF
ncbi:MAG: class I SAM-dependent methyltransferase, partial [Pirellulaceae bacterium]|nr:class I SAM-dependent methyltransferase [Pirellulaceae bacterium]